jgi:hypothetical protein
LDAVCVPPLLGVGISGPTTSLATRGRVMLRRRAEPFGSLNAIMAPVRLSCGKGNVDRCAPARSSMQHKARVLHIGSFHALSSHEWLASHCSLSSCQSVRRLSCGKGTASADCRGPRSFEHNSRHACCILDRFTHSLLTSGVPRIARSAAPNQCA